MTKSQVIRRIRSARRSQQITYAEAADRARMHRSNWCAIESGNRSASWQLLREMAKAVGIRVTIKQQVQVA